jgi:hypothetical protein
MKLNIAAIAIPHIEIIMPFSSVTSLINSTVSQVIHIFSAGRGAPRNLQANAQSNQPMNSPQE